jgi:hypothetical protein
MAGGGGMAHVGLHEALSLMQLYQIFMVSLEYKINEMFGMSIMLHCWSPPNCGKGKYLSK